MISEDDRLKTNKCVSRSEKSGRCCSLDEQRQTDGQTDRQTDRQTEEMIRKERVTSWPVAGGLENLLTS